MIAHTHEFNTESGVVVVDIEIHNMDAVEAIDVYGQSPTRFASGGYRVTGIINGVPAGTHYIAAGLSSFTLEGDARDEARAFLADAKRAGKMDG